MRMWIVTFLPVLVVAPALAGPATAPQVESNTQAGLAYRVSKIFDGVITAGDFSGKELDPKIWSVMTLPGLDVYAEGGTLHIKGVAPEGKGRYTASGFGVFSLPGHSPRTKTLNAVMAARMKVNHDWRQEGFESSPKISFHFCGTGPDINASIIHGLNRGKLTWGLAYGGDIGSTRKIAASQPDLAALVAIDDHQWQTLFTVHRGSEATGYILGPEGRWLGVGGPLAVWMFSKRIELKVLYGSPGYKLDIEFDDARLYPLPGDSPIRIALCVQDSRDPRRQWAFKVRVVTSDGRRVLAEKPGGPGGDLFDLTLPSDMVYPVAAKIQLFHGEQLDAEFPIEQQGVKGLYPGDIWLVDAVPPPRATPLAR